MIEEGHDSAEDFDPRLDSDLNFEDGYPVVYVDDEEELARPELEPQKPLPPPSVGPRLDYADFFIQLFLEVYDIEKGYDTAVEEYTKVLLARGIEVNPQLIYNQVDLFTSRLTKVVMVKRLCSGLGLIGEQDIILQRELDLLYGPPARLKEPPAAYQYGQRAAGEIKKGDNNGA